jgi:hypothetical protein
MEDALTFWVTIFGYEGVEGLFGCLIARLETKSEKYQSFVNLNDFLATQTAHRALVLDILHYSSYTLRKFAHQITATYFVKEINVKILLKFDVHMLRINK